MTAQARWDTNTVTVDGVSYGWSLEPCRSLAPPPAARTNENY
ncbi:MAG: hypothetical protein ABTQ32_13980 [Myxococcaceae bacterium]